MAQWTPQQSQPSQINGGNRYEDGDAFTVPNDLNRTVENCLYAAETAETANTNATAAQTAATNAQTAATNAEASANSAATSASNSATSASNAETSAQNSSASASASAQSATNAETAATNAQNSATATENSANLIIAAAAFSLPLGGILNGTTGVATLTHFGKTILGVTTATITLTNDNDPLTGYTNENQQKVKYLVNIDGDFADLDLISGEEIVATDSGWFEIPASVNMAGYLRAQDISQADYDALGIINDDTFYVIGGN